MFAYVHNHVHVIWSHVCACMFESAGMKVYVYINLRIGLYICLYVCIVCMYVCMHMYIYVCLLYYECM